MDGAFVFVALAVAALIYKSGALDMEWIISVPASTIFGLCLILAYGWFAQIIRKDINSVIADETRELRDEVDRLRQRIEWMDDELSRR